MIEPGTLDDYRALARFHYLGGEPATCARVLTLRDPSASGRPLGVLVVSMPVLNARWRELAWPGRYRTGDPREDARRLNAEVRVISRLVVDPRVRGLGMATRLVRAYLESPLTPATECVSAMGALCGCFRAAGMTAYALPPSRAGARLADALARAGLETWRLADDRVAGRAARDPFLARELRIWARDSPAARPHVARGSGTLAALAASLAARPLAFAHSRPPGPGEADMPTAPKPGVHPREPVPPPAPPPEAGALPHPLTFFLSEAQRREVVRALRTIHPDRTSALLRALGADPPRPR